MTDWREHRQESFLAFYRHHLAYRSHPGCVYALLPAVAEAYDLDDDGRAWLVWLNGNTQNIVTSLLLLDAAPTPARWADAVDLWNRDFKKLEWDTDRRHQKSKFGEATEDWYMRYGGSASHWFEAGERGWAATWSLAFEQPHMGRLSSWSMIEYARILFGADVVPDAGSWMLEDKAGSRSHRNGIATVAGYDAVYWEAGAADLLGLVPELGRYADELLAQVDHPDASRLTMESALCTWKGWFKPNRRYPNVYSDMTYYRIKKAEARSGRSLPLLWDARRAHLPAALRLEDNPGDPGLVPIKQNWYRETGEVHYLHLTSDRFEPSGFEQQVAAGAYGTRKDPTWK